MKYLINKLVCLLLLLGTAGCKKYLNLDPPSDLSGNNFWQSKQDVEQFTNGLYQLFRQAVFRSNMQAPTGNDEFPFFAYSGDLRGAPFFRSGFGGPRNYFVQLRNNDIRGLMTPGDDFYNLFNHTRFTMWDRFYKVIAAANIAMARIGGVPGITDAEKARYNGEAVFMRCISYFFMVRLYGDVPYYTDAYHSSALKRMKMVEVLKNCAADMKAAKDGLPWTYDDPAVIAVRAMRGSALALLMHINMWLASFDAGSAQQYYQQVDALGNELEAQLGNAYALLPLENTRQIFKGRTKEGLFEIPQNVNYGESFGWSAFSDNVLRAPYKSRSNTSSYIYYEENFMRRLYPDGQADKRINAWFSVPDMFSTTGKFLMLKFANVYANENAEDLNPDDNQTVFRLPDAILLHAEAVAQLGNDARARDIAQIVRNRAGAAPFTTSGKELQDDIFFERCRELMGEGHYWYDVVRTQRIIDNDYRFGYHCSAQQYKDGAWTWPINASAKLNNPGLTLNAYWE